MTTKKPNGNEAPMHSELKPTEKPAPSKKMRPTPEQLQQISRGGSYVFNPETGKLSSRRAPTKAATVGTKKGAK